MSRSSHNYHLLLMVVVMAVLLAMVGVVLVLGLW